MRTLYVEHAGEVYDLSDLDPDEPLSPEMRQLIAGGTLMLDDEVLGDVAAHRVRARLLGIYEHLPSSDGFRNRTTEPRRFLIPGLWPWGHVPMLGGPPKAGKTTLVADLAASLVVPERRFLDHFEASDLTQDANHGGSGLWVYLINAETPAQDFEDAIVAAGVATDPDGVAKWLAIDHLTEDFGGPTSFDLTRPEVYDLWLDRLVWCEVCNGSDFAPPSVLIVDGLTAILGSDTTRYGAWYAALRRLTREAEIANALVTAHNGLRGSHLMQGVESMAQADGLWNFSTDNPDASNPKRYFSVTPRIGGVAVPRTRVTFEEGRLRMRAATPKATPVAATEHADAGEDGDWATVQVLSKLREAGSLGLRTTEVTGSGRVGKLIRAALGELLTAGQVRSAPEGQGQRWFLIDTPA